MAEALNQTHESERPATPVEELVAYLRANPYKFDHPRHELAKRFGLDEEFVDDVLDALRGSPNKLSGSESFFKTLSVTARSVATYLARLYEEFTERPVVAVLVTLMLTVAVVFIVGHAGRIGLLPVPADQTESAVANSVMLLGATMLVLHAFVYFRHGMMRYAIYGAMIVGVGVTAVLIFVGYGRPLRVAFDREPIPADQTLPWLVVAGLLTGAVYFMFATVVSLAGGYWHTSKADRAQKRLTRQELIDRLFYLQERMRSEGPGTLGRRGPSFLLRMRVTPWLPIVGLSAGIALGLVTVLIRGTFNYPPEVPGGPVGFPGIVGIGVQVLTGLSFLAIGFLSGGVRRAIVALVLMFAGTLAAEMVPYDYFGPRYIEGLKESGELLEGLVNTLVFALLVGMGAHIDRRARVRQKLQEYDPAHVAAEIVEIQWRLNPSSAASCVVVVDVAGSTRMKAEADPLAVEYSFRAYHEFIAGIAHSRGGTVLSTAGDGAVLTFGSCAEALYAAKEIQTKFGAFNARVNRLPSPFRVRIGIHTGQVSAQLHDVPFNELIDIAAHVEKEAPVGGIAVTQRVVESIQDERVAALKDQVDGQNVYVVLNPNLVS